MQVLITGGAGFIGSHIAELGVASGHRVRVFDNLYSGKRANLETIAQSVELVIGDIRDQDCLREAMVGCEVVFHQAAVVSVPVSIEDPRLSHAVNIEGTLNVLSAARATGVTRVILASSAAVYGDQPGLPKREDMATLPTSPYGLEKLTGEHYMRLFHSLYGLQTVCLRYFNVFGPRQDASSQYSGVISRFVEQLSRNETPTIFGDGQQCRDFVFVKDVAAANWSAAVAEGVSGRVFNIGRGDSTTLLALYQTLSELFHAPTTPKFAAARSGDIRASYASIHGAHDAFGYQPSVGLRDGLKQLVTHLGVAERTRCHPRSEVTRHA